MLSSQTRHGFASSRSASSLGSSSKRALTRRGSSKSCVRSGTIWLRRLRWKTQIAHWPMKLGNGRKPDFLGAERPTSDSKDSNTASTRREREIGYSLLLLLNAISYQKTRRWWQPDYSEIMIAQVRKILKLMKEGRFPE